MSLGQFVKATTAYEYDGNNAAKVVADPAMNGIYFIHEDKLAIDSAGVYHIPIGAIILGNGEFYLSIDDFNKMYKPYICE